MLAYLCCSDPTAPASNDSFLHYTSSRSLFKSGTEGHMGVGQSQNMLFVERLQLLAFSCLSLLDDVTASAL